MTEAEIRGRKHTGEERQTDHTKAERQADYIEAGRRADGGTEEKPAVSVIVPVYNTEPYLERCLDSLLRQSLLSCMEIIIVNDGSEGDPLPIVRRAARKCCREGRIRYIAHPVNQGLLQARITGVKAARGDYIGFVDSDDHVSSDYFGSLYRGACRTGADIMIGRTVIEDEGSRYIYTLHDSYTRIPFLQEREVRDFFFGQAFVCYSCHTVWNKLYRRSLWQGILEDAEKAEGPLTMTEDIAFSTMLFYSAQSAASVPDDAYFYCRSRGAATDNGRISGKAFRTKVSDIRRAFDLAEAFLRKRGADAACLGAVQAGRDRYARLWRSLARSAFRGRHLEEAEVLLRDLSGTREQSRPEDHFPESITCPWRGGLEYIKDQILDSSCSWISFDCFDTLVRRPFREPSDLFRLLDPYYRKLTGCPLEFSALRAGGERMARKMQGKRHPGQEDIRLEEVYDFLSRRYAVPADTAARLMEEEIRLEQRYVRARESGRQLFELTAAAGKQIVLITDMYLSPETIGRILTSCGYTGYRRLYVSGQYRKRKDTGSLFRLVLEDLGAGPDDLLHIGDSWKADIEGAGRAGIRSVFLPAARESFAGRIRDYGTGRCASIWKVCAGSLIDRRKTEGNLAFRCMQAMAAERYFDNPYRAFDPASDFNADPGLIGHYLLGMHMAGLTAWIRETCRDRRYGKLWFLARDGWLPFRIMKEDEDRKEEADRKAKGNRIEEAGSGKEIPFETGYLYCSRRAMLPFLLRDRTALFHPPSVPEHHSPASILDLYAFCTREDFDRQVFLQRLGRSPGGRFADREDFERFVGDFLEEAYDGERHEEARARIRRYFSRISPGQAAFDMGYSGRIQEAVCAAAGCRVDALYVHEDPARAGLYKQAGGFQSLCLYPFSPSVTGMLREFLFSGPEGSCTGYDSRGPVLEERQPDSADILVRGVIQREAIRFVREYRNLFGDYEDLMQCSGLLCSLPFEGWLRHMTDADRRLFAVSEFEDMVYGGCGRINMEVLSERQEREADREMAGSDEHGTATETASGISAPESGTRLDQWKQKVRSGLRRIRCLLIGWQMEKWKRKDKSCLGRIRCLLIGWRREE